MAEHECIISIQKDNKLCKQNTHKEYSKIFVLKCKFENNIAKNNKL